MPTRIQIRNISQQALALPLPLKGVLSAGNEVITSLPKATLLELFNTSPYGSEFVELTDMPLTSLVTPGLEGSVDMGGSTFTNLAAPVNDTDAATKLYVDTSGGGGGGGVSSVTASSPLASSGGATPNISITAGATDGDLLTWDTATSAWVVTPPTAAGITAITGDVTTTAGPGSVTATVAKLQGNDISTTAPTSNQILQWISGTSQWTPAANGVGLGSKVLLVVEGGAYATIQAAIDASADNDVILVGPKAAGGSWGPAAFSPGKRLIVSSLLSKWSTQVRVDSITFNANSGLNILLNTVFVRGLYINSSFTALAPGVNFYGSAPARLRLQECFIFNSNAAAGTGVVSNNSGSGSSLYIDNCIIQSGASTGIGVDHQQGYTAIRNDSEISRYQYPLQCAAGTVEIIDSVLDGTGIANEVIRITGGFVTCGYSTIKNSTGNASGVNITVAAVGVGFGMGDATFAIATGSGYCVTGAAGAAFLYGHITYSNSAAAAYNVKVKNTLSAIPTTQAFTASP